MKILVGLGNPGSKYDRNRHNVGFMALDEIARVHDFGTWREKFNAAVAEGRIGTEKVLLLKPLTFMNLSGDAVQAALGFYKLSSGDIIVFHDELDLAPGKIRLKTGGGHAGHNGLRSIAGHIGADFQRVRIGIGHPGDKSRVASYVLSDFAKVDAEWLPDLLRGIARGMPDLIEGNGNGFSNAIAQVARPATAAPKPAPAKEVKPSEPKPEDTRSPLQKLADRFSKR